MKTFARSFGLIFGILTLVFLASGCGMDQSPVAPEEAAVAPAPTTGLVLAFSPETARQAAAKLATIPPEGRSKSEIFGASATELEIKDKNGWGYKDDLKVKFSTRDGALDSEVEITMTVYGNVLSEIVAAFQPGGLIFLRPATLELELGADLVDLPLDNLQVWHIHDDGTVEEAEILSIRGYDEDDEEWVEENLDGADFVNIEVVVPGFSRYSPGGGDP